VRWARRGAALWVTIDRAERRNAINTSVLEGIERGFREGAADAAVRAIVLTGAGDRAFCAGADLGGGAGSFSLGLDEPQTDFGRLARYARELGVPTIAAVNGDCVAGGMALMALCDLAVAAEHARFGLPEARVGVFPMQVLVYLRRLITARQLNALCLTGALISAARAAEIGLINEVAPAGELDARIEALVARISGASPMALKRGKAVIAAMETMAFEEALSFAEAQIALASRSTDAAEGLAAFNEKRKPSWAHPAVEGE
jgi:enoyl-CoA hydratase/carnithine racemase